MDGSSSLERGKIQVARVGLARALVVLPLLHHGVILVEAGIGILDDKGIFELDRGRSQETFTWLMLLCRLLLLLCLKSLSGRK